ncbi:hypothetical protein IBO35_004535 [Salmonella enterica]|nr:hypothetical protein [Salmonella enterica]EHD0028096.1 hypothetical protein [Salmonella enterica subsp. houtenae serovar 50:g,z51:-]EFX3788280.1 hypothetical protein [Salmonella enterica]EGF0815482.1 hypothetical protein [Salmonella enterica]EGG9205301.1 hypothetical protein [Salmonella enterica]
MLFTKWRFLFNIVSNSRNPSFVKVDLKKGPAVMRGFLRFKHDISESTSNQLPGRPKQPPYPLWLRCGVLCIKENQRNGWLREDGRQETALTASCLICSCH